MSGPRLSLIISTYDQPAALAKVLAGVAAQTLPAVEILVSDDGSREPTRQLVQDWVKRLPAPVRHVWQENAGFRKSMILNQTVAAASGEYLVFLDGDCVPHSRFLEDHARLAERGCWVQGRRCFVEEAAVAGFAPGRTRIWQWMLTGRITGLAKAIRLPFPIIQRDQAQRGIIGCNLAAWRDDVIAINGFDEEYSGWFGEDSDLGTRLYHLGRIRKFVHGHAVVYHLNHPPASREHVQQGKARLQETLSSGRVRCARGIGQYLTPQ